MAKDFLKGIIDSVEDDSKLQLVIISYRLKHKVYNRITLTKLLSYLKVVVKAFESSACDRTLVEFKMTNVRGGNSIELQWKELLRMQLLFQSVRVQHKIDAEVGNKNMIYTSFLNINVELALHTFI